MSNTLPEELKYTKTHEWGLQEANNIIVVGITDHAQQLLGDMVFVELPEVGDAIHAGDELGDRVLHLDARVHLDEVELAALVHEELDGAGIGVPSGLHRGRQGG